MSSIQDKRGYGVRIRGNIKSLNSFVCYYRSAEKLLTEIVLSHYRGIETLDPNERFNAMEKIIPTCEYEGQYLHPGPIHVKHAMEWRNERPEWLLNTDAHLRSVLLGRSETIPLIEGEMALGEFGVVYFADFDQTRERTRTVRVTVIGE